MCDQCRIRLETCRDSAPLPSVSSGRCSSPQNRPGRLHPRLQRLQRPSKVHQGQLRLRGRSHRQRHPRRHWHLLSQVQEQEEGPRARPGQRQCRHDPARRRSRRPKLALCSLNLYKAMHHCRFYQSRAPTTAATAPSLGALAMAPPEGVATAASEVAEVSVAAAAVEKT